MPPITRVRSRLLDASLPRTGEGRRHVSALADLPAEAGIPVAPAAVVIAESRGPHLHLEGDAFDAHGLQTGAGSAGLIEQVLPPRPCRSCCRATRPR